MSVSTLSPSLCDSLNDSFGIDQFIHFEEGPGGFALAHLHSEHGSASVSIYGGHVLSYQPTGHEPVLWVSEHAQYKTGKAIRGGIPVIWPWFGPDPLSLGRPSHGFARTSTWEVKSSQVRDNGDVELTLGLQESDATLTLWHHSFRAEISVVLSTALNVELSVINTGDHPFDYTGALHTYFNVSAIENVSIHGLEDASYIDQLDDMRIKEQAGAITFKEETDRIYIDSRATCQLIDSGLNREIRVEKAGSKSTVIWNPWIDKSKRMSDFGDDEWKTMLCIETANAGTDVITLNRGGQYMLSTRISAHHR